MRICIDVQPAIGQRAGVGRYTTRLVQSLAPLATQDDLRIFYFDFKRHGLPFAAPNVRTQAVQWCPGRLVQAAWKSIGWPPFDAFAGGADIYHFPNFIVPPLRSGRSVVTIHDMSFLRHPAFAERRNCQYLSAKIRDTAKRADRIITDSHFSAGEIHELLQVSKDRITPIHLGIEDHFTRPDDATIRRVTTSLGLDKPYLLTVGTIEPRKNLTFLVECFERLQEFDGKLVLVGGLGWKVEPILRRIRESSRAADILVLNHLDDAVLPALYAGAEQFLIASHYEGFGFPPLEAMACGTPVISSHGGSLPEVLGDGALLLADYDVEAWVQASRTLLTDSDRRLTQIEHGLIRAASFRWSDTARLTWDVYSQLMGTA